MAITKIPAAGFTGNNFRNIIINGDMSIAQRGTSVSGITGSGYNTVDRFSTNILNMGTFTESQSTDVPTGQGFATSLKLDCTTADASPAAGDNIQFRQKVEAQNLQYLKFGTSSAESITLSFWVKSVKTGTYIVELRHHDATKFISQSYTISLASTWEKKTLTFPGYTTTGFGNDNAAGLFINWWLGAGTNFTSGTLNTSWNSLVDANSAVGQVNLADDTANEWYITGVQLEAGTTASDFEFLPVDVNLARCRRYFETNFHIGTTPANGVNYTLTDFYSDLTAYQATSARVSIPYKVTKRANPTITFFNITGLGSGTTAGKWQLYNQFDGAWTENTGAVTADEIRNGNIQINVSDSYTSGYSYLVGGGFTASAEL